MRSEHKHTYEFSSVELMEILKDTIKNEEIPGSDHSWKLEIMEAYKNTGPIQSGKPDFVGLRLIAIK